MVLFFKKYITYLLLFYFLLPFYVHGQDNPVMVINTKGHTGMIRSLNFTPTGRLLISVSEDKTIRFWEVQTGSLEKTLRGELGEIRDGIIYTSAISPNGLYFAISGYPSTYGIRTFNLHTGDQIKTLKGNKDVINDLCFSPDGQFLASACSDFLVRIWRVAEDGFMRTQNDTILDGHIASIYKVSFSPDSKKLVSASFDGSLRLWELDEFGDFQLKNIMVHHLAEVRTVVFTPDGKYIISGGFDERVLLWDNEGNFIKELAKMNARVQTLAISPDSKKLLVHGSQGILGTIFEVPSGKIISTFKKHNNTVLTSSFYNNEIIATAGGNDKDIYLWDVQTGKRIRHFVGKGRSVWNVAFAKKGLEVAFGTLNPTGFLKDCPLQKSFNFKKFKLKEKVNPQNYHRVTTLLGMKQIKHIDPYTLKNADKEIIFNDKEADGLIRSYTLGKDGNIIVGSSFSLKKYDYQGKFLFEFKGHTGIVWATSISSDDQFLVSSSADQTIRLWNYKTGELLTTLFVATNNEWICLTPKAYYCTSDRGEEFIGWHVNHGVDFLAEYFPVENFRDIYYRPKLVKKIIKLASFKKAVHSFNNK